MSIEKDFDKIMYHARFWNWLPDLQIVKDIYDKFPDSYSVLTPFLYAYMKELIRSMTSDYGIVYFDKEGKPTRKKVGFGLIMLASEENKVDKPELTEILEKVKQHYLISLPGDAGDNRNSVLHGYSVRGIFCVSEFRPGEAGLRETWRHMTAALAAV